MREQHATCIPRLVWDTPCPKQVVVPNGFNAELLNFENDDF